MLEVAGEGGSVFAGVVGTNTLVADDFVLEVGTRRRGPDAGMSCTLADEGDVTIDAFEATATPTPTVSPTATPARPVIVQTDFAGDDRSDRPAPRGRRWPKGDGRRPRWWGTPLDEAPRAVTEGRPVPTGNRGSVVRLGLAGSDHGRRHPWLASEVRCECRGATDEEAR